MTPQEFKTNREQLELTQAALGKKLGVSDQQICNIEKGKKGASKSLIKLFETLLK